MNGVEFIRRVKQKRNMARGVRPRGGVVLRSFAMLNEAAIFSGLESVTADVPFSYK
jgi:hypothetical protein